jgi:hypothetical protein
LLSRIEDKMRSVVVFLRDTNEDAVKAYLDAAYPQQREPWIMFIGGDACLYIDLYHDGPREHEPEQWTDIVRRFGGAPVVAAIAHVSGRHRGDEEALAFVTALLTRFSGAALDEYTDHLWSLTELRERRRVGGHSFFDYNGWFTEQQP